LDIDIAESHSNSNQDDNEITHIMDTSKPVGDACREDGTLKDASEMDWPNSPTEQNRALIEEQFRDASELDQPPSSGSDELEAPKAKVRNIPESFLWDTYLRHTVWLAKKP
jgi:hypothetical protein